MKRFVFLGLGGNSFGPLLLGRHLQNAHPDATIILVDGKEYHEGHVDHEFFLRTGPKPIVQARLLHAAYPNLTTMPICAFLDRNTTTDGTINISNVIIDGDYVIMVVDNHETRRLVAEHADTLTNITLISGAIDGNHVGVWVHLRRAGTNITTPPLTRYPDIAKAPNHLPVDMLHRTSCLEPQQTTREERPNYFALLTNTTLTLNALWLALTLDEQGRIHDFPYVDTWCNVQTMTATPNKE